MGRPPGGEHEDLPEPAQGVGSVPASLPVSKTVEKLRVIVLQLFVLGQTQGQTVVSHHSKKMVNET